MSAEHAVEPDHQILTGFGRATRSAAVVTCADTPARIADRMARAGPRGVLARGLGRSYGDAAQNGGGAVLRLSADPAEVVLDDDGLAHVPAGVSLDDLLRAVVPRGWFIPVTPGTRQVTVGGAVAADVHGKNHHVDGSVAAHVAGLRLVTPTGILEVTPERDPEVFWATAGGMGLTGVITQVSLRLLSVATSRVRVDTERASDLDDLFERMVSGDPRYRYSVAWVDTAVGGRRLGRGVLTRGDHATVDELPAADARDPLAYAPRVLAAVPASPMRLVRPATIRAFNAAWYRRAPDRRTAEILPLAGFFHPLDAFGGWNGLFGPRGFVQYQFVVPEAADEVVRRVLGTLASQRLPSSMAVLKRFGAANPGPLSFPGPGWTLALDLPVGPERLHRMVRRFDQWVAAAGGRVYLAKDACLTPEMFAAMYPRLPQWQQVRDRLDPDQVLQSDLARRLGLLAAA